MNLLFLGTGAADRFYLTPENDFSDHDKRRCSAALLNGTVLLDCGPHVINALQIAGISPAVITDIVVTHTHPDHFLPDTVLQIANAAERKLKVWVRCGAGISVPENTEVHEMTCFEACDIAGFKVTGVPANHDPNASPQHLAISDGKSSLFYGLDGAWFRCETVDYLKEKKFDVFVIDGTVGDYIGDYRLGEHNSIPMIRLMAASMKTLNIVKDDSRIILSHLAVCLHKSHAETCEIVKNDGLIIASDGMNITF